MIEIVAVIDILLLIINLLLPWDFLGTDVHLWILIILAAVLLISMIIVMIKKQMGCYDQLPDLNEVWRQQDPASYWEHYYRKHPEELHRGPDTLKTKRAIWVDDNDDFVQGKADLELMGIDYEEENGCIVVDSDRAGEVMAMMDHDGMNPK